VLPKLVCQAVKAATKSKGTGSNLNYRLGAVLFDRKGRVVVAKPNSYKTHPFALKNSLYPFLHAEVHCLVSNGLDNCEGCGILVVRLKKNGSLSMAKPCPSCLKALLYSGIKDIYYSDWNGNIQRCPLKENTNLIKQ
jgi:tRNA(Arg) A34 adenosine deaminase TadA